MSQGNEAGRQNSRPGARDDARVIEVDIPSDVQYIEKVVELVQRECALMRFGARQLMLNLAVALTEALSNAILRGNNDDPAKHVHVMARVDPGQLRPRSVHQRSDDTSQRGARGRARIVLDAPAHG